MTQITKSLTLPHAATDMFALVCDIRAYPQFLHWFVALDVIKEYQTPGSWHAQARSKVRYAGMNAYFTTHIQASRIDLEVDVGLIDGPLEYLNNHWRFTQNGQGCQINLNVAFAFNNPVLRLLSRRSAHHVSDRLTQMFTQEAQRRFASAPSA